MKNHKGLLSSAIAFLLAMVICGACAEGDSFDYNKKGIFVTGTETNPMVKFVVEDTPSSYTLTAQSTSKTTSDIKIDFAIDNSLLDAYNKSNSTSFQAAPEGSVELENPEVVIKSGAALSSVAKVKVVSTENFVDGATYVIPVTIKSVSGANGEEIIESSKTVFLKIARVLQFTSLVNNWQYSSNFHFDESKYASYTNYTYEVKVRADGFGSGGNIQRVCSWGGDGGSNMLRFGENGMDGNQLQWVSPAGSVASNTRFQSGTWYLISLVYDGSTMTMYVNGVKDASINASNISITLKSFELGMSWTSYRFSQFFRGRIAEVRVWNRALSPTEMANGICGVDPSTEGLVAYWKLNEGKGPVFKDATGHGYDMDWNNTYREEREGAGQVKQPAYGNSLKWVNDANNKCAQ